MAKEPSLTPASTASPVYSPFDNQPSSNLPLGILGGLVAAAIGAGAWAAIAVTTGYRLGLVAIGIGILVGVAVRKLGNGTTMLYGVVGSLLAAAGCAAGNVLAFVGFMANEQTLPFMSVLTQLNPALVTSLLVDAFEPMDAVFYAIALYEGFKLSIVKPAAPVAAT